MACGQNTAFLLVVAPDIVCKLGTGFTIVTLQGHIFVSVNFQWITCFLQTDSAVPICSQDDGIKEKYVVQVEDISDDENVDTEKHMSCAKAADNEVHNERGVKHGAQEMDDDLSGKFKAPRTDDEMDEAAKKRLSDSTKSKMQWALRAYDRWVQYRRKIYLR